jgi:hypothetical protein
VPKDCSGGTEKTATQAGLKLFVNVQAAVTTVGEDDSEVLVEADEAERQNFSALCSSLTAQGEPEVPGVGGEARGRAHEHASCLSIAEGTHVFVGELPCDVQNDLGVPRVPGDGGKVVSITEHSTPHGCPIDTGEAETCTGVLDSSQQLVDEDDEEERGEETTLLNSIVNGVLSRGDVVSDADLAGVVLVESSSKPPKVASDTSVVEGMQERGSSDTRECLGKVEEDNQSVLPSHVEDFIKRPGMGDRVALGAETILCFHERGS